MIRIISPSVNDNLQMINQVGIGVFALIAHFIADISYAYLDPRIRIQSQG